MTDLCGRTAAFLTRLAGVSGAFAMEGHVGLNRRQFSSRLGGAALGLLAAGRRSAASEADTSAAPIRIGIVGTRHSHFDGKLEGLLRLDDRFELVGIAEDDPERRRELAASGAVAGHRLLTGMQLMELPGLEAVAIETHEDELVPTARRWISAGRHVHLEKPGGESLPVFEALLADARRQGLVLQLGYMLRHHPAFELAFQAVRDGWLGEVYELHGVIGKVVEAGKRQRWAGYAGGTMYVLGAHLIDVAVAVLGEPEAVDAYVKRTRPEQDDLADNQLAVLSYPRALATIRSAAVDVEGFARRELAIHGDRGAVTIRPLEPARVRLTLTAPAGGHPEGTHEIAVAPPPGRYDGQLLELARVIRGEKEPDYPYDHERATQETLLRAAGMPVT